MASFGIDPPGLTFENNGAAVTVNNHGRIFAQGAGGGSYTQSNGSTTINSGGLLQTRSYTQNNGSTTINSGGTLTTVGSYTQSAGTTTVGGTLGVGSTFTASGGSVQVDGLLASNGIDPPGLIFENNGAAVTVNNHGRILAVGIGGGSYTQSNGSTTINSGGLLQTRSFVENGGTARIDGQVTTLSGLMISAGSTLLGTGTINGNLSNAGILRPGDPGIPGFLFLSNSYAQSRSGIFMEDLSSLGNGALITGGDDVLSGTLDVNVLNGFLPLTNTPYEILSYTSLFGTFDTVNLFGDPNQSVTVIYDLFGLGQIVAIEFQTSVSSPTPEPASLMLFATGLIGMAWFLKKKRFRKE